MVHTCEPRGNYAKRCAKVRRSSRRFGRILQCNIRSGFRSTSGWRQESIRSRLGKITDTCRMSGPVISSESCGAVPPLVLRFISQQRKRTPMEWGCSDMARVPSIYAPAFFERSNRATGRIGFKRGMVAHSWMHYRGDVTLVSSLALSGLEL